MISHLHKCIFTAVPRTASKSVRQAFGLPLLGRDYHPTFPHIVDPYGHTPLATYQDQPFFSSYFKFAFVRNPWDRAVSAYFYLRAGGCNEHDRAFQQAHVTDFNTFETFVHGLPVLHTKYPHLRPQSHWLLNHTNAVLPDFVGRYETLADDFKQVQSWLAAPTTPNLLHVNQSQHEHYKNYYTTETWLTVARVYEQDIRLFGCHASL